MLDRQDTVNYPSNDKKMRLNTCFLLVMVVTSSVGFVTKAWADITSSENMFVEMLDYARLADAAYENKATINATLKKLGYSINRHENLPGQEVSYYLASNDINKTHVIAVRGTANVDNALLDIAIKLIANQDIEVQLHEGFATAAASIYDRIKSDLKKDYQIRITGHSLGGAIAMILAMYLDADDFQVGRVVTFGQPKVTNITGALKFLRLDVWRVVTKLDVIPLLPPLDPMDINNLDIYWHIGEEIILLDGAQYSIANNMESMMRATKFLNQVPSKNNLLHHQKQ